MVLGTDVFDRFLEENRLRDFALEVRDDQKILKRFLKDAARAPGTPGPEASMRCQVRSFVF